MTPVTMSLAIYPKTVKAGERVAAVATSSRRSIFLRPVFHFNTDGGKVTRTNAKLQDSVTIDTTGVTPGMYMVRAHVYQGRESWHQADAETTFEVIA